MSTPPPEPPAADTALLAMQGVHKSFDGAAALRGADFALSEGEIHGLLGGNGAGKTTLMNILYGLYRADAGEIRLHGRPLTVASPKDAIQNRIGMVHQHFLQVEVYTVTENVVLGTGLRNLPSLDLRDAERAIADLADRFGLRVEPRAVVEDLPVGARQRVEILKALYRGARILVLDEPTSNLTPQEVESLFASLRAMVDEGMSIVFITHKIREALASCQRMTVLRDGRRVLTVDTAQASQDALVRAMVGEHAGPVDEAVVGTAPGGAPAPVPETTRLASATERVRVERLEVVGEHGRIAVADCSLNVHAGEILGVAGVAGNGQRELAEALAGVRPVAGGRIYFDGQDITRTEAAQRLETGIVYIPEDRHHDALLPTATIAQNLILGAHRRPPYRRGIRLDSRAISESADQTMAEYHIRAAGPDVPAGVLSGGNIQRLILARAFARDPRLLVAHNPTRGLDIPSAEFVYGRLRRAGEDGAAILLVSEDLDELLRLSTRIAVMYSGRIPAVLGRDAFDPFEIGRLMAGVAV